MTTAPYNEAPTVRRGPESSEPSMPQRPKSSKKERSKKKIRPCFLPSRGKTTTTRAGGGGRRNRSDQRREQNRQATALAAFHREKEKLPAGHRGGTRLARTTKRRIRRRAALFPAISFPSPPFLPREGYKGFLTSAREKRKPARPNANPTNGAAKRDSVLCLLFSFMYGSPEEEGEVAPRSSVARGSLKEERRKKKKREKLRSLSR